MRLLRTSLLSLSLLLGACTGGQERLRYPAAASPLALGRVVLYRNGVGYFERQGEIDGDILRIKVRKDQVNDLLKSLTIVDRKTGKAVSVSMPLDPQTWANAALATLAPGQGSLAQVLDGLRGVDVELDTVNGTVSGRIVMVERTADEPDPTMAQKAQSGTTQSLGSDWKVTLMEEEELRVVRLSKVKAVTIKDGDLAMQFHRRLDATAGEGMFQQVEVAIRLMGEESHDLVVSYVVEAPMWKPTYRVVLPEKGGGKALLQAWAVVDNVSGEDWRDVKLALTAGAPIAFQYDLHTPRRVDRDDLSNTAEDRRARVALGETSFEEPPPPPVAAATPAVGDMPAPEEANTDSRLARTETAASGEGSGYGGAPSGRAAPGPKKLAEKSKEGKDDYYRARDLDRGLADEEPAQQAMNLEGLRRSTVAQARASQASGLTRFDIDNPVTVPDGNSTMVAIVNQEVEGEETFLFDPNGGGGSGYEQNPFRVVRFRNTTPFVLESGPISIYSGGSFVGEGISQVIGSNTSATVPFAVEPGIVVTRETEAAPEEMKLLKIVSGVIHVERYGRVKTVWKVQAQGTPQLKDGFKIFIRHPRYAPHYTLQSRPEGAEDLPNAYLVPVQVGKGLKGGIELIENTPTKTTISIMDGGALPMLERALQTSELDADAKAKLAPIIKLRQEVGELDAQIEARRRRLDVLERQMEQARENLRRLKDMKGGEAEQMRIERARKLEEWTKESDGIARELLTIEEKREQKLIQLDEMLQNLTIEPKG
jgi:uncharacterized protein DUF4139